MLLKHIFKKHKDYSEEVSKARIWLNEADAIIVGIGSGFVAASGIDEMKPHLVKQYFKDYYRMGYKKLSELSEMYSYITPENAKAYWGYWARYMKYIGYEFEVSNGYRDLLRLVRNRNYFVYTTSTEGLVQKAGFDETKILSINGDCRFLQCSKNCCDKLYKGEELLEGMIKSMGGNLEVDARKVPRCPHCGEFLIPHMNLKRGETSVFERLSYAKDPTEYEAFLSTYKDEKIVYLDLGLEGEKDQEISHAFEKGIKENSKAKLIRMTGTEINGLSKELLGQYIAMAGNLEDLLAELTSGIVSID